MLPSNENKNETGDSWIFVYSSKTGLNIAIN